MQHGSNENPLRPYRDLPPEISGAEPDGFFTTIAHPVDGYPPAAAGPTVYYAQRIGNPGFPETVGAQTLTANALAHTPFVFDLSAPGRYLPEGSTIPGWKRHGQWYTQGAGISAGVTHRRLQWDPATNTFTTIWSADYDVSNPVVTGIGEIFSGGDVYVTSHQAADGTTVKLFDFATGADRGVNFAHGNDLYTTPQQRQSAVIIGGAASVVDSTTWRYLDETLTEFRSGNDLRIAVRGLIPDVLPYLAGISSGGKSVAKLVGDSPWIENPSGGLGRAEALSILNGSIALCFSGAVTNLFTLQESTGLAAFSASALNGQNLYAVFAMESFGAPRVIAGGERDAITPATIVCYSSLGLSTLLWTYDTASTVRSMIAPYSIQPQAIFAAGDRNASQETLWAFDINGNLLGSYDHGADLRHVTVWQDAPPMGTMEILIAGDRSTLNAT